MSRGLRILTWVLMGLAYIGIGFWAVKKALAMANERTIAVVEVPVCGHEHRGADRANADAEGH